MIQTRSTQAEWEKLASLWYSEALERATQYDMLLRKVRQAMRIVNAEKDVEKIGIALKQADIDRLAAMCEKLSSFSSHIHQEIVERIDVPYCKKLETFIKRMDRLDPAEIQIVTDVGPSGRPNMIHVRLTDILGKTLMDESLYGDFVGKMEGQGWEDHGATLEALLARE